MGDIYFWRQAFILLTGFLSAFSSGMILSFPAVLSPAITSPNSTDIRTTEEHATWIASIHGFGGFLGSLVLSPIMQSLGRKAAQHTLSICMAIGWIILPFAKNITAIYVARIIQGLGIGAFYINGVLFAEYVHPTRRGYFIALKKVAVSVAALCCHAMGIFWTWRQIALFSAIPPFLSFVMTYFWPESPPFLALKGRFSEAETSFNWLNGNSRERQKELESLIEAQRKKIISERRNCFKEVTRAFWKRSFQKALLLSLLLTLSLDLTGRYFMMAYLVQVMKELFGNNTSAIFFTLGADSISVLALSLSTIVIKCFNRRTVLFSTGIFSVLLMLLFSVLVYLMTVYTFSKFVSGLTASVLILQCFIVNVGIAPVSYAIMGEIFPLEHRGLGVCISSALFTFLYTISMILIPFLIINTGLHGTFAILGVLLAICCGLLYKILPETTDKTLQDIEDEITGSQCKESTVIENEKLMQ